MYNLIYLIAQRVNIINIILISLSFGQDLNQQYKNLAEYCILRESLTFWDDNSDWGLYPEMNEQLDSFIKKRQENNLDYSIKSVVEIKNIKVISIEDKTNIGPFPNKVFYYAIKDFRQHPVYFKFELFPDNIEYFINKILLKELDNLQLEILIKLFNNIHFCYDNHLFYSGSNPEEFEILKDEYKLQEFNKINCNKIENVYKIINENSVSYFHILYQFDNNIFKTEETLLYKIKV